MIKKLQLFFEKNIMMNNVSVVPDAHQLNLAAAALLIEMILQDDHVDKAEVLQVKNILVSQFELSEAEMESLYALAEEEKHQATDYHQFTKLIASHYTQPQKIQLIESLWRVAYADEVLDKYEEHMVRRISDLIHVSHKDFIQAKHRAENA